jgi:uncharacterized protein
MLRDEVLTKLKAVLPDVRREFGVQELYIFGSVARGEDRPDSDVDVLVEFFPEARPTLLTFGRLQEFLEQVLGRAVDIVENHPRLRPAFRQVVEAERRRVA